MVCERLVPPMETALASAPAWRVEVQDATPALRAPQLTCLPSTSRGWQSCGVASDPRSGAARPCTAPGRRDACARWSLGRCDERPWSRSRRCSRPGQAPGHRGARAALPAPRPDPPPAGSFSRHRTGYGGRRLLRLLRRASPRNSLRLRDRSSSERARARGARAGLHTGECELLNGKIGGIAVHIGARVAKQAQPSEVLVSSTVKDLVSGSGLQFDERGVAELKGVPGEWRLFSVEP